MADFESKIKTKEMKKNDGASKGNGVHVRDVLVLCCGVLVVYKALRVKPEWKFVERKEPSILRAKDPRLSVVGSVLADLVYSLIH